MADVRLVSRGRALSVLLLAVLLAVGVRNPGFASDEQPGQATNVSHTAQPVAPDVNDLPSSRAGVAEAALPIPRVCFGSISRMAACLSTAAYASCGVSFSKFLGCTSKVYNAYDTTQKILAFRTSTACPMSLAGLVDYLCSPRVPQAPRSVGVIVGNGGYPLGAYSGPSRFYTYGGTYASGTRLSVVCVARFGQTMNFDGASSPYWSRLSNGWFLPWIALQATTSDTIPWC